MVTNKLTVGTATPSTNWIGGDSTTWPYDWGHTPNTYIYKSCNCGCKTTDPDNERAAIKALCDALDALNKLDGEEWQRVADYVAARFGVTIESDG